MSSWYGFSVYDEITLLPMPILFGSTRIEHHFAGDGERGMPSGLAEIRLAFFVLFQCKLVRINLKIRSQIIFYKKLKGIYLFAQQKDKYQ